LITYPLISSSTRTQSTTATNFTLAPITLGHKADSAHRPEN